MNARVSNLTNVADLRQRRASENRRFAESRWYYAKKTMAIFPGVDQAIAPSFLKSYYRRWEDELTLARRAFNRAVLAGYRAWIPERTKQIAERYGLSSDWQHQARNYARQNLIDPHELAIFRVSNDEQLDAYLRRFEWARIHRQLVPQHWTPDCRVAHKIDFYLHAMEHRLPVPALRAVIQDGRIDLLSLPQGNRLVVKPENGRAGRSVFVLDIPDKACRNPESLRELLACNASLRSGDWVVQDHISPHHKLAGLAMSALPTIRVITMLNEADEPEILVTYLRFPSDPRSKVDNFALGGLMGLLEPSSGILQNAVIMSDLVDHETHPTTGEPIAGVEVPFWQETCELVRQAHSKAFSDYRLIGWDIAITNDGPVIIEGNAKPCPQGAQQVQRRGLGATRFGELISWNLEHMALAA